jgi:hypothetical protein
VFFTCVEAQVLGVGLRHKELDAPVDEVARRKRVAVEAAGGKALRARRRTRQTNRIHWSLLEMQNRILDPYRAKPCAHSRHTTRTATPAGGDDGPADSRFLGLRFLGCSAGAAQHAKGLGSGQPNPEAQNPQQHGNQ